MESVKQKPPQAIAFEYLVGLMNSLVISSLLRNNVFETLGKTSATTKELAENCQLNQNVLGRALRFVGYLGMVNSDGNNWALTDVGRCFLKDTPGSLFASASMVSAPPWRDSWMNFEHCLKSGEAAFNYVFGEPFFQFLDKNQEYGMPFNQHMNQMTSMVAMLVADAYDFSSFQTICDVGGGRGLVLKSILEKNPGLKGILYDFESVVKDNVLENLLNRVDIKTGNFFETVPKADCMILKTIIHDWNDENAIKILTNCRKNLYQGGKILLIEQVVEYPLTLMAVFYDLHMQVMLGGAERTEEEFKNLFDAAGLQLSRIIPTKSPMKILEVGLK